VAERGSFSYTFEPDTLGNANRVIALTYSPVPEPGTLILTAVTICGWLMHRRFRTHFI
jgi:hypothetical protein